MMNNQTATNFVYCMGKQLQARIEMEGMIAENKQRERYGESMAYSYDQFKALIEKHDIHHERDILSTLNAVISNMQSGR